MRGVGGSRPGRLGLAPTAMPTEVIPVSQLGERELAAWRRLGEGALSPNPFAEPEFVLPASSAWGVRDLSVLVVRQGADWLGCLPVRAVRSWRGVPGSCLAGWRHPYCYLGTPLVLATDPEAILRKLIAGGMEGGRPLALDWIDADGPLAEPLTSALVTESRPVFVEAFERAALYRQPGVNYLEETLSSRTRSGYRRKLRLLEREVGAVTVRDRSDDPSAYRTFLELERAGWRGPIGTAMASISGHGEFFTDICEGFSRSGRLRLLCLESEQHTIAMKSDFIAGDVIFFFKPVFDEKFAQFSPGMQLELASIERFYAGDSALFDSCTQPDNAMYNKLWTGRRRLRSMVATRRDPSGAAAYVKWRAAAAALPVRRRLTKTLSDARGH